MENYFPDIEAYLKKRDPELGKVIDAVVQKNGRQRPSHTHKSGFEALACSIVSQQLSVKAAASIYRKFKAAFADEIFPINVRSFSHDDLRSFGLSRSKARYLHNLSDWFSLHGHKIANKELKDEELITLLTEISGIGAWTVQMFLIFYLKRPDVLPLNDLGIQKGVQRLLGLKRPAAARTISIRAKNWQPFRSIACLYLWRAFDLDVFFRSRNGQKYSKEKTSKIKSTLISK